MYTHLYNQGVRKNDHVIVKLEYEDKVQLKFWFLSKKLWNRHDLLLVYRTWNHPYFAHDEDGTATPNQFSDNLRVYVRASKDGDADENMEHKWFELDTKITQEFYTYNPFTFGLRPLHIHWKLNRLFYSNPQVRK